MAICRRIFYTQRRNVFKCICFFFRPCVSTARIFSSEPLVTSIQAGTTSRLGVGDGPAVTRRRGLQTLAAGRDAPPADRHAGAFTCRVRETRWLLTACLFSAHLAGAKRPWAEHPRRQPNINSLINLSCVLSPWIQRSFMKFKIHFDNIFFLLQ